MSLYKLTKEHFEILEALEECFNQEATPEAEALLDRFQEVESGIEQSVEKHCWARMYLLNEIEACEKEKKRIEALIKKKTMAVERIQMRIQDALKVLKTESLAIGTFKVKIVGCKQGIHITDLDKVPQQFIRRKEEVSVMASDVYAYMKELGVEELPFAKLIGGKRLSIK